MCSEWINLGPKSIFQQFDKMNRNQIKFILDEGTDNLLARSGLEQHIYEFEDSCRN
jgi:hypothetical protein